jgi:voltage-gated potassium channel
VKVFEGADLAGKTLAEARIRQTYFVVIIAIIPEGDVKNIKFNPGSEDTINEGDSLIVLGDIDRIDRLRAEGCEDNRTLEERVSRHDYLKHMNMKT